jgi:hypothetical protein
MRFLLSLFLGSWVSVVASAADLGPRPLIAAHAHNDYEHPRPLFDALACGFASIEADIHLVDGRLLVAHDRKSVKPERTLEALYLDPLRARVRENGGRVYRDGPTITLLVDVKSEAVATDAALHDFRGFSGQIAGGIVRVGQKIIAFPAGLTTTVKQIWTFDGPVQEAFCPQSVTLVLEHDIDISRGSMLVGLDAHLPGSHADLQAEVCWMHSRPLQPGKKYFLKHTTHTVQVAITEIVSKLNLDTLESGAAPTELAMNDIGEIRLRAAKPLVFDGYATNRLTGSFILIEPGTNATVAAGMMRPPRESVKTENSDYVI